MALYSYGLYSYGLYQEPELGTVLRHKPLAYTMAAPSWHVDMQQQDLSDEWTAQEDDSDVAMQFWPTYLWPQELWPT